MATPVARWTPSTGALWLALVLLGTACMVPSVDLTGRACDPTHPCEPGQQCAEGLCQPGALPPDAGPAQRDAAEPLSDAGTPDAAPDDTPDAGPADARPPNSDAGTTPDSGAPPATPDAALPDPIAHWKFDEGSGETLIDSAGSGHSATLSGTAIWTTGILGSALVFNGTDTFGDTSWGDPIPYWTVSTWVKSGAEPAWSLDSGPVMKEENFIIAWNHQSEAYRGAAALMVGSTWYSASFGPLAADTWYHLVATYDGSSLTSYKQGRLIESKSTMSGPAVSLPTHPLTLGRHAYHEDHFFSGVVDETRIYDRALSRDEVQALHQQEAGTTPVCGNGNQQLGEQCDDGTANGTTGSCCTAACRIKEDGAPCGLGSCASGACVGP